MGLSPIYANLRNDLHCKGSNKKGQAVRRTPTRILSRSLKLLLILIVAALAAAAWLVKAPLSLPESPYVFDVRQGSSLRAVANQLSTAGVISSEWIVTLWGRLTGKDRLIKAGNYEIHAGITLPELLAKLTQGDATLNGLTIVEGSNFADLKQLLRGTPQISKRVIDLEDAELMRRIGGAEPRPEGLFFPETYYFATGSSDEELLRRAYRIMSQRLLAAWGQRASGLPLRSSYEALILASIVEKETGRAPDRPVIASVFINRLRFGMKLQTDPTVIYGAGPTFDGDLRRHDLRHDTAYNTYMREGLPPTPIAFPSQASLDAVLHPPQTDYLYFVSRGDGTSQFSSNLADHNRAVAKYQRRVH